MAACDWIQTGERTWQCVRCGRRLAVPLGLPVPPNFRAAPPCGWQPKRIALRGHVWYEIWGKSPATYVCPRCGQQCTNPVTEPDCNGKRKALAMAGRYATALTRWAAAGFPTRSESEVHRLHAICQQCEHYDRDVCRLCGCRCNTHGAAIVNKLRMATESCPAVPPRWTATHNSK